MGCSNWCSEEFARTNFLFSYAPPRHIVTSQWKFHPLIYIIWRVFIAIYNVVWIILSGAWEYNWYQNESDRVKWFIYLTNWMYFLLTINLIAEAISSVHCYATGHYTNTNMRMTWYLKTAWLLNAMGTDFAILVGIAFWTMMYSPGAYVHPVDINTHGTILIYQAINICITAMPVRIYHVVYSMCLATVYILFTVIYYFAGGTNSRPYKGRAIYTGFLDWDSPGLTAGYSCGIILLAFPIVHLIYYGLFKLRRFVYIKCYGENAIQDPNSMNLAHTSDNYGAIKEA